MHGSSQNSSFTVIQLSLQLGLNLQKRRRHLVLTLSSRRKHNSNNFIEEGYLPVSNGGTILDLFNCRVDAFLLQEVVSLNLVYISYPVQ